MYKNVDNSNNLTPKQIEAINMIVMGFSVDEIASKLNLNPNTIYRWKANELFKEKLYEMQIEVNKDTFIKLKALSLNAVNVLKEILNDSNKESNKLKASMFVLEKVIQLEELDVKDEFEILKNLIKRSIEK